MTRYDELTERSSATGLVRSILRSGPGKGKRLAAVTLGGALVAVGLRRRSLGGTVAAFVGGWLFYHGIDGRDGLKRVFEVDIGVSRSRREGETTVERSITVNESADELHQLWRDPENLGRIMGHFAEVTSTGENRQQWVVNDPTDRFPIDPFLSWESEIVEDTPGEVLRWESLPGADIPNEGAVRFREAPGDRGTEVTLSVRFDPPGGALGGTVAEYLGIVPDTLTRKALRNCKSLAEAGEVPTLERNPSARGSGDAV